ncbi:MAG: hypothetical protein CMM08_05575 [Rhodospirillaceae bacterium]|nr:hypothetical protein [Rhodospirillaceae bacterium]
MGSETVVVGRAAGWLLAGLALLALGAELVASLEAGAYRGLALGELWYALDVSSLNLIQAVVQRHLWPLLWDPMLVTVLRWPAWISFGLVALALVLICRRRDGERRPYRFRKLE